jgi:hypothetical protein
VDPFPDLDRMSDDELASALAAVEEEETACSLQRKMLHGRIDMLRPALVARLKAEVAAGNAPRPAGPGRSIYHGVDPDLVVDDPDLGPMPDVEALSTDELRALIRELESREDDVSLRRRVLQGKVDILRAERARRQRGEAGVGPDDLGSILGGHG